MRKRIIISCIIVPILIVLAIVYVYQISEQQTIAGDAEQQQTTSTPAEQKSSTDQTKENNVMPKSITFQPGGEKPVVNPIAPVGTDKDGRMYIPDDITKVYWYKFGPTPGNKGNAIIAGHRDWGGKLGLFQYLEDIKIGEKVVITDANDKAQTFQVVSKKAYSYKNFPTDLMDTTKGHKVTLISCTGRFIKSEESYENREVVILEKV
ncbi:class F sortase [Listeria booriae]|uniref:Class F sortase n=1 Tax=Listeria booriae TaxID=1552123 RepID=A0A099VVM1_9LIST|nr:class F sortase [Listeria booriae]KGL37544.1 hypothetical protein EP57_16070 [Listeria booriae]MBC1212304.1 class F sortase [Listeria booriae]MBC1234855.1 class F sortase [Listeria booriae]MBC1247868.1 class F sortase [Listeria booriae]MBC1273754.1 class F sortase [Listeria booriae]